MRAGFLILAFALAGCATIEQEFNEVRNAWQGASYEEAVSRWGAPTRSATHPDGRQTHTWVSQEAAVRSAGPQVGVGVYGGSGGSGVGVGVGFPFGVSASRSCERSLTFRDNFVVEQTWSGDPAYCRFYKRAPE